MVWRVSVIPYTEVSMKKERASMNAWWFRSPTQLLILQKEREDYFAQKENKLFSLSSSLPQLSEILISKVLLYNTS